MPIDRQNFKARFGEFNGPDLDFLLNRYNRVNRWVIADMVRRSAHRHPEKAALVFQGKPMSYLALEKASNQTANALIALGVGKYDRVAVLAHNTLHHVLAWLGCCKAGAVYLPINYLLSSTEIQFCINHSESKVLVVEDAFSDLVENNIARMPSIKALIWSNQGMGEPPPSGRFLEFDHWCMQYADVEPDVTLRIEDPCQLSYTSGTESAPKGVVINNQSLLASYMSCIVDGDYNPSDICINALPLYHSVQRNVFMNPVFYIGGTNILMGPDIGGILENIETYGATMLFATPTVWIGMISHPGFDSYDLSSLKKIYCGMSAMPAEVLKELKKRFDGAKIYNFYGQTELAPYHTMIKGKALQEKPGSAGRAGLNMEMRLESDDGRMVRGSGRSGEICGRGPHVMMMYFKDPETTENAMEGGWFHSGDLGALDEDGYLSVIDRKKDVVRSGAEAVISRMVESVIYLDDRVEEVAVVGVPHPDGTDAPIAVIVPAKGCDMHEDEIFGLCRRHLASFQVPRKIIFVRALPKTPTGKLLKREIRRKYSEVLK